MSPRRVTSYGRHVPRRAWAPSFQHRSPREIQSRRMRMQMPSPAKNHSSRAPARSITVAEAPLVSSQVTRTGRTLGQRRGRIRVVAPGGTGRGESAPRTSRRSRRRRRPRAGRRLRGPREYGDQSRSRRSRQGRPLTALTRQSRRRNRHPRRRARRARAAWPSHRPGRRDEASPSSGTTPDVAPCIGDGLHRLTAPARVARPLRLTGRGRSEVTPC